MKKLFIFALLTLILGGCASRTPIMTPSGNMGYKIWCESMSYCYNEAAKACPDGYTIHGKDQVNFLMSSDIDGLMIIECK